MKTIEHNDSEKYDVSPIQTTGRQQAAGSGFEISTEPLAKLGKVGTTIKKVLDEFKTSLQALNQQVEKNKASLDGYAKQVTGAEETVKLAEKGVEAVERQAKENTEALDQLERKMEDLLTNLTALDNLDEQLTPLQGLDAKLKPLEKLEQVEEDLTKVAKINERFNKLNSQFQKVAEKQIKFNWQNV